MTEFKLARTFSPLSSSELIAKEKARMSLDRFSHCIGVSQTAQKLARLNHYDEDKAALAGFVHDYAKQIPVKVYRQLIQEKDFDPDLLNWNRAIWHGLVGYYFIEQELQIQDPEILQAVKRHTTADVEMTTLDKIVFVSDFIEPHRDFPGVAKAREIAFANLDQGVGYELAHTLSYLVQQRARIYPLTLAAYNVWSTKKE